MIYWDTSALLKTYAEETDSPAFRRLLIEQANAVAISPLHRTEMFFALHLKEQRGEIEPGYATGLAAQFDVDVASRRYRLLPESAAAERESRRLLVKCLAQPVPVMLRTLDGLHLGAALAARCRGLVTGDKRMKDGAAVAGLPVFAP